MTLEEQIQELKIRVEKAANRIPSTPKDFLFMSETIRLKTQENISKTTLMRIWSYIKEDSKTRSTSLNILSRFLNFRDFYAFQEYLENYNEESQQELAPHVRTTQLNLGQFVEFKWNPNKRMVAEYIREDEFEVKISENSKLKVGSLFSCSLFVQGQPLHIFDVRYQSEFYDCYVIGQHTGLTELKVHDSAPKL